MYTNTSTPNTLTGFAYDYMLKDHLGNVRMVLTEEQQTNYYPAATLEGTFSTSNPQANSMVNHEKQFYNINSAYIVNKPWSTTQQNVDVTKQYLNHNNIPPAIPNPNYPQGVSPTQTAGSTKMYRLNATTNKTGLELIIKVMAGDKVDILGKSYHTNATTVSNSNSGTLTLIDLLTNLLVAPGNPIGAKGITAAQLSNSAAGIPSSFFRGNNNEGGTTIPKAYINYIFLDEQFKFAGGSFSRVGSSGTVKDHWSADGAALQDINVPKNGYLFVYVSNESNFNVFFDNLQVVHKPGPMIEETHYYPFGLTMAGVSSQAANTLENKFKFNKGSELQNKEFSDGSGLEWYGTFFRMYDPQIGGWHVIDPKPDYSQSVYSAMANNPILYNDPLGDTTFLYNKRGLYRGYINDGLQNEIVIAGGAKIKSIKSQGHNKEAGLKARSSSFATARITANTIKELTAQWKSGGNEKMGFLYADKKTKEVHISMCTTCKTDEQSGNLPDLAKTYDDISKKGQIIGMWHTHPPANSLDGAKPSGADQSDPPLAISQFGQGALGMVVNKNTVTLFPINNPALHIRYTEKDEITTPKFGPNYSGWRSDRQYGVFNRNVNSKSYWDE